MPHALKKSVGPFSAGTRVNINNDNNDGTVNIEVIAPEPEGIKEDSYSYEDLVFDIEKSDLVELRSRSENINKTTRKERRTFLSNLFEGTKE